jgi:hypothetical protein
VKWDLVPWGFTYSWLTFLGAASYRLERSDVGQPFEFYQDVQVGTSLPTGGHPASGWAARIRPGSRNQFRFTALGVNGSVLATSATVTLDAPSQYPQITNLTATVGPLQMAIVAFDGTSKPARTVTWSWTPAPGIANALGTWDRISTDPVSNQVTTSRWGQSFRVDPGFPMAVEAGTTVRICLAALRDPFDFSLAAPTCLDTPVPGGTISTATGPASGGTGVPGGGTTLSGGAPQTGGATILNDATPPSFSISALPAGLVLTYPGTSPTVVRYTVCRESPPGSPCVAVSKPATLMVGSASSHYQLYDMGLQPGGLFAYRVTAWRSDGHFGESAPQTGIPEDIPPPTSLRVVQDNSANGQLVLGWTAGSIIALTGSSTFTSIADHQLIGTGMATAQMVSGNQATVALTPGAGTHEWKLYSMVRNPAGGWFSSRLVATLTYPP